MYQTISSSNYTAAADTFLNEEFLNCVAELNLPDLNDPNILKHKKDFEKWLNSSNEIGNTSFVLAKKDIDHIAGILNNTVSHQKPQEKYQFNKKKLYFTEWHSKPNMGWCNKADSILGKFFYLLIFLNKLYKIFERVQIDLIDMRCKPDGDYKWIAHCVDHTGQFHVLWPQMHKTGEEVKKGFKERWFGYFGLPKILQSDNGLEFKNANVLNLIKDWNGECTLIYGRPRHPQTQGLTEQASGTVERQLGALMVQFKNEKWCELLPKVMYNMNTLQNLPH